MKIFGIIPARYASSRFPGKPLVDIQGKPMIRRVYEQAKKSRHLERVIVATDDDRIYDVVRGFGGEVLKTSPNHPSGTDRCNEVLQVLKKQGDVPEVIVNIQGDEPFIQPGQIDLLCSCFESGETEIATLAKKISFAGELFSESVNKVVVDKKGKALYFSRSPIPFQKNATHDEWLQAFPYLKHIGIYGYRATTLEKLAALAPTPLEQSESLEQLRWLENGYSIHVEETQLDSISVDTPGDLLKFTNKA